MDTVMSIEQLDTVDFIGLSKESNDVCLGVSDHVNWDNELAHLTLLQEKINKYLSFIESGEINDSYPDAKGKRVTIEVILKYPPTENAIKFFKSVKQMLNQSGYGFQLCLPE
jgi:hypothetical protein